MIIDKYKKYFNLLNMYILRFYIGLVPSYTGCCFYNNINSDNKKNNSNNIIMLNKKSIFHCSNRKDSIKENMNDISNGFNRCENQSKPNLPKKRFYILLMIIVMLASLFLVPQVRSFTGRFIKAMSNPDQLQDYIRREGKWAPFIFIFIQTMQVIIAPIPGNVTTLAGGLMFGSTLGFIYGSIGLIIGSTTAFYLARFYGKPFVIKIAGADNYEKYSKYFTKKSRLVLFLLFLFPFFPDDMLCFLAGISTLTFGTFILFVILARLPGVYVSVFIGSGSLNLPVWSWILIAAISLSLIYFSARYGDKIEDAILTKIKKVFKKRSPD